MKAYNLIFFVLLFALKANGQIVNSDSSQYIHLLNTFSENFIFSNTDSSLQYAQKALFFARRFNLKQAESKAYYLIGGNYWIIGNYPIALESELQSLHLSEIINDKPAIADTYRALASIYRDNGDFANAMYYAKKCLLIADEKILTDIYTITGSIFEKYNHLDSAVVYLALANKNDTLQYGKNRSGYISLIFGNVYYKEHNYQPAINFYLKGIALIESQKVYKDLIEAYNGIAKTYTATGQVDSSILYLQKALMLGQQTPFLLGMLDASTLLYYIYKPRSEPDSIIKYMQLSLSLTNTLYNQEKARAFQALAFKEKLREQELEEIKEKTRQEHLQNVQIASIAAFILIFFIVAYYISRRKVKKGVIEFLVLIWLLLVFEFISLLIHSQLEIWTHHTPVLMLLAMVAIAAVLVPSHHRILKFLTTLLTKPNKIQTYKIVEEEFRK